MCEPADKFSAGSNTAFGSAKEAIGKATDNQKLVVEASTQKRQSTVQDVKVSVTGTLSDNT